MDERVDDIRLTKLYNLTSSLNDKKRILFQIKTDYGFVYQESKRLAPDDLVNQSLQKTDFEYVYLDSTGPSLDDLAKESKFKLIKSIIELHLDNIDILSFLQDCISEL